MINSAWLFIILPAIFMAGYCWGYISIVSQGYLAAQKKEEINPAEIGCISRYGDKFFIKEGTNRIYKEDIDRYLQAN